MRRSAKVMYRLNLNHNLLRTGQQFLAVGLPIVGALFFWSMIVQPILASINERNEQIEAKRVLLGKYLAVAENEDRVNDAFERLGELSTGHETFKAKRAPLAAALLQGKLKSLATTYQLSVHSATPLPLRNNKENVNLIGVRISLSGSLRAIHKTIHAIESNVPYMFIEAARLKPKKRARNAKTSPQISMTARLDVYSLFETTKSN